MTTATSQPSSPSGSPDAHRGTAQLAALRDLFVRAAGAAAAILTGLQSARWPCGDRLVDTDDAVLLTHVVPLTRTELTRRGLLTGDEPAGQPWSPW